MFLNGLEKSEGHAGAILQAKNIVDITWLSTDRYMKNSFEENMTKYHLYTVYVSLGSFGYIKYTIFQVVMMLYSTKY